MTRPRSSILNPCGSGCRFSTFAKTAKKTILFAIFLLAFCHAGSVQAEPLALVKDGKTEYAIILPEKASEVQKTAATELQTFLKQMTDADFPIKTANSDTADTARKQIVIGPSALSQKILGDDINEAELPYDAIVIKTVGNTLVLSGHPQRGMLYAVYTFLEESCGCRWWTAAESFIPKKTELKMPPMRVIYSPKLIYREAHYLGANHGEFAARMKNNGALRPVSPAFGGHHRFQYFVHSFYFLIPPEKYFESHPEWFSEINGKRTADTAQLCLTNEEMTRELIKNAKDSLRQNPEATFISISQNDWHGYCQCEECTKIAEEEGSQAGLLLRFVNRVAEAVEEEFPHVFVETLAYQYTRKPPKITRPLDNVIVRLCSIECSFSQPLADGVQNATFREDIVGWSGVAKHLFIWDYVTNFPFYMLPHPNYHVLGPNIEFFVNHHVIGIFEQGDDHCATGDLVRMRNWVISKKLWNPELDDVSLRNEFIVGYYGEEFLPFFEKYFALMEKEVETTGFYLGIFRTQTSDWLSVASFLKAYQLWNEMETLAKKLETESPEKYTGIFAKIRRERMPIDLVWIMESGKYRTQARLQGISIDGIMPELHELVPDFIARLDANDVRQFREWNGDISLLKEELSRRVQMAGSIPTIPDFCVAIPENRWLDIQDDAFHLHMQGVWTDVASDENASNRLAIRMPGDHYEWAMTWNVPAYLSLLQTPDGKEGATPKYHVYAYVRCDSSVETGPAMTLGIYDSKEKKTIVYKALSVEEIRGTEYQKIDLGSWPLTTDQFFWAAPPKRPGEVEAVYVDRLIVVREDDGL